MFVSKKIDLFRIIFRDNQNKPTKMSAKNYPVKSLYPDFKNLTHFRKAMSRIKNAGIRRDNRMRKYITPSGLLFELNNGNATGHYSNQRISDLNRYIRKDSWEKREKAIRIVRNTTLVFELQHRSEINFDKRVEFYQAMLSRDYKTVSLCDDVIGVIFEFLPKHGMLKLPKRIWANLYRSPLLS